MRTNDESSSILMGITRDSVLQLAEAEGFKTEVGPLSVQDMTHADEAFLCGTACEVVPVAELDGQRIGQISPGPITEQIGTAFDRAKSGMDAQWAHWLHPVSIQDVALATATTK